MACGKRRWTARAAPWLWTAELDAGQIKSAISNLCINGRDAMPGGGRMRIEADRSFRPVPPIAVAGPAVASSTRTGNGTRTRAWSPSPSSRPPAARSTAARDDRSPGSTTRNRWTRGRWDPSSRVALVDSRGAPTHRPAHHPGRSPVCDASCRLGSTGKARSGRGRPSLIGAIHWDRPNTCSCYRSLHARVRRLQRPATFQR